MAKALSAPTLAALAVGGLLCLIDSAGIFSVSPTAVCVGVGAGWAIAVYRGWRHG